MKYSRLMANQVLLNIEKVKKCAQNLSSSTDLERSSLIRKIACALQRDKELIFEANKRDLQEASDLPSSVFNRLKFDQNKLDASITSLLQVSDLQDPIGKVLVRTQLDENFLMEKISVPLGVIGMVFEARPDAFIQIVSLALKSGNCLILKGGKEAKYTNEALFNLIQRETKDSSFTSDWILLLSTHEDVSQMLKAQGLIDLIIPRGSYAFVRYVQEHTNIPVLGHSDGLCNMYIDEGANLQTAYECALDAKINYPAACNAVENLVVHSSIASTFLPKMKEIFDKNGVKLYGDERTCKIIDVEKVTEDSYDQEYLSLELSIKIVDSLKEAIDFIGEHGSKHTDVIITQNKDNETTFLKKVDSSCVFCNCSTRFSDGYRLGLGAEVGISTTKIHSRGPVGVEGLMSTKFIIEGNGQVAKTYMGKEPKAFLHDQKDTKGPSIILGESNE